MIFLMIFPLIFFFITLGLLRYQSRKAEENEKKAFKKYENRIIVLLPCLVGALTLLDAIPKICMMDPDGSGIPIAAAAAVSLFAFAAAASGSLPDKRFSGFIRKAAICAAALIAAEVLVFNGKSFVRERIDETISMSDISLPENASVNDEGNIVISEETVFELRELPDNANAMIIETEQLDKYGLPFDVFLSITDDNSSAYYITHQHKRAGGRGHDIQLAFRPYGKLRSMELRFAELSDPVAIKSVRVLSAMPFSFSCIRYFLLLAAALMVLAIKDFRLYAIAYDRNDRRHFIAVEAMVMLCTLLAFCFTSTSQGPIEYAAGKSYTWDPYAMTLDAFEKGQVWLDIEPDPGLADMENVYDISVRDSTDIPYEWDYAYYDGHYYCYFGASPVISYYYPYYILTGKLPSEAMALNFFVTLGIFFMCMTMLSAIRLLKIKPNLLMLLTLMPAMVCSVGFYYLANDINRYNIAVAAGLCFVLLSLYMGMTACTMKNKKLRPVLLLISGASLALCVGSRPTISLCAAVLVPFFIDILLNKKEKLTYRLLLAGSFLAPLAVGAALIMNYNAARFGSPFEFGAVYQLTVSDIHANSLSLSELPAALYHYFLILPSPRNMFPFLEESYFVLDNYSSYKFIASNFGVFSYPVILLGALLLPEFRANRQKKPAAKRRRLIMTICLAVSVFVAWADFCIGGTVTRYSFDFMPLMALAAMTGILCRTDRPTENRRRYVIAAASAALTVGFSFLSCFIFRESTLVERFPNLLETAEDLIIFWQ